MENISTELTKEEELQNQKTKFPIIAPTMVKIINRKKNNNTVNPKNNRTQIYMDYNKTSINTNNLRRNLPKIMTSYTPIEKRIKYSNHYKNKNSKGNKVYHLSRNFDLSSLNKYNSINTIQKMIIF